jgi:hypothetical protein
MTIEPAAVLTAKENKTMETKQPSWKCIGHIGDVDPIAYGGGFVYIDETGIYPPELTYFEPAEDSNWQENGKQSKLQKYRVVLDAPRFKTLTDKGKRECFGTKELPANQRGNTWYWYSEWYVKDLVSVANACGTRAFSLLRDLMSRNPMRRAFAYESLIRYFGVHEFDSYPRTLTEGEAYARFAEEMKLARIS